MSELTRIKTPILKTYDGVRMAKAQTVRKRPGGKLRKILLSIGIVTVSVLIFYLALLRPWFNQWGATDAEIWMTLPGDEIVGEPEHSSTRAITVHAPADRIWPWIAQIGYQRAGWYSYDWVGKVLGWAVSIDGDRSADRIVPELQTVNVGDVIFLHPKISGTVALAESDHALLLQAGDPASARMNPANYSYASWLFYLQPVDAATTRLIVRSRADYAGAMNWLLNALAEPGNFLMEQKMMRGIRERAESAYQRSVE